MSAAATPMSGQQPAPATSSTTQPSQAPGSRKPRSAQAPAAFPATGPVAASSPPPPLPPLLLGTLAGAAAVGVGLLAVLLRRRRAQRKGGKGAGSKGRTTAAGPCSKLKPTSRCAPLADGSGCVIRREIAADNSCLFNSVGYAMHKSRSRAPHLRTVVAQQVSSDRTTYSDAFLGLSNEAYCHWIRQPYNWGGGIELSILAQAYGMEIAAWNIESCKEHVFGEESGYKRQVMVIYNGVHYDALAVCAGPRANPDDDETSYNPRTKRGKMIIAAARKLVELAHKESLFHGAAAKKQSGAGAAAASAASAPAANGPTTTAAAAAASSSNASTSGGAAEAATASASAATASHKAGASALATRRVARGTATAAGGTAVSSGAAAPTDAAAAPAAEDAGPAPPASPHATAGEADADGAAAAAELAANSVVDSAAAGAATQLSCSDCGEVCEGAAAAQHHALATGHQHFREVA